MKRRLHRIHLTDLDAMQSPGRLVNQVCPTGCEDQEGGKNEKEADPAESWHEDDCHDFDSVQHRSVPVVP